MQTSSSSQCFAHTHLKNAMNMKKITDVVKYLTELRRYKPDGQRTEPWIKRSGFEPLTWSLRRVLELCPWT